MKISKTELTNLIKEEYTKMMETVNLKKRLNEINETLKTMEEEYSMEEEMDEVKKTGENSGEEWYEKNTPVAKFEKLKSKVGAETATIKEDGEEDEEVTVDAISGEEVGAEVLEMSPIEKAAANFGKAIADAIGGGTAKEEAPEEFEMGADVTDETETETEAGEEVEADEAGDDEEAEEITMPEAKEECATPAMENTKEEGVKEEVTAIKEEEVTVNESKTESIKEVVTEGKKIDTGNKLLKEEFERMKVLANITKREE